MGQENVGPKKDVMKILETWKAGLLSLSLSLELSTYIDIYRYL